MQRDTTPGACPQRSTQGRRSGADVYGRLPDGRVIQIPAVAVALASERCMLCGGDVDQPMLRAAVGATGEIDHLIVLAVCARCAEADDVLELVERAILARTRR